MNELDQANKEVFSIHVIEDEADIAKLIQYNLALEGYVVHTSLTGEEGLKKVTSRPPDLILLDLMLPGIDGLEICRQIRKDEKTKAIPIIMVTAKGEEQDVVRGLEMGADDYIVKPFSPKVLVSRVKAVLRRSHFKKLSKDEVLEIHDIAIHPGRHEITVGGQKLDLTHSEFLILHFLCRKPGWVFTRSQIVDSIRGNNYAVTDRSIDVQIVGLRKKMGLSGNLIETVRGVGYRFKE